MSNIMFETCQHMQWLSASLSAEACSWTTGIPGFVLVQCPVGTAFFASLRPYCHVYVLQHLHCSASTVRSVCTKDLSAAYKEWRTCMKRQNQARLLRIVLDVRLCWKCEHWRAVVSSYTVHTPCKTRSCYASPPTAQCISIDYSLPSCSLHTSTSHKQAVTMYAQCDSTCHQCTSHASDNWWNQWTSLLQLWAWSRCSLHLLWKLC